MAKVFESGVYTLIPHGFQCTSNGSLWFALNVPNQSNLMNWGWFLQCTTCFSFKQLEEHKKHSRRAQHTACLDVKTGPFIDSFLVYLPTFTTTLPVVICRTNNSCRYNINCNVSFSMEHLGVDSMYSSNNPAWLSQLSQFIVKSSLMWLKQ
jgi:hypothetical protein